MSDSRGRGGRGRGGGDRGGWGDFRGGDRGGRGGFRGGDRGGRGDYRGGGDRGGRGDYRGGRGDYRGGGDRGGRGDYRGGRGDYRGGGGGDRGGRGDFYGGQGFSGRGRGGRGGGRAGGRPQLSALRVFGEGAAIPAPDARVTALEDNWLAKRLEEQRRQNPSKGQGNQRKQLDQLTTQVAGLSIAGPTTTAPLPIRPAFGNKGQEVLLWANYFDLTAAAQTISSLTKYALTVTLEGKQRTDPKGNKVAVEAKGRKLKEIVRLVLDQFPPTIRIASEFKAQIVSLGKLKLPEDNTIKLAYTEPGRDQAETWIVKFNDNEEPIQVDALVRYLANMTDSEEGRFPKYSAELDALGVIMGHMTRDQAVRNGADVAVVGNRFFTIDQATAERQPTEAPLTEILRGYVQSVRLATGRLLLNTNVTHSVFRRPLTLTEVFEQMEVAEMDQIAQMNPTRRDALFRRLRELSRRLAKVRVEVRLYDKKDPNGRPIIVQKVIAGLASSSDGPPSKRATAEESSPGPRVEYDFGGPQSTQFYLMEPKQEQPETKGLKYGGYVRVSDYYKIRYNVNANLKMPLINVKTKRDPVYVLAEQCRILPGQPSTGKLSRNDQDSMITFACRPPPDNAISITTAARKLLGLDNNRFLTGFGISVGSQLITVKGRELPPPNLLYKRLQNNASVDSIVQPADGSWLMRSVNVVKPCAAISSWTFLCVQGGRGINRAQARENAEAFTSFLNRNMGITIPRAASPADGVETLSDAEMHIRKAFQQLQAQGKRPGLVMVILPDKGQQAYQTVKKLADVEFGFQTVCMVQEKFLQPKGQAGYFANVALKINLKFGGVNHKLQGGLGPIKVDKTMFVGYDVTHPTNMGTGAQDDTPSMVGLVASIDAHLAQWPAIAWNNPAKQEMLGEDFTVKFQSRLALWRKYNTGRLPEDIIIFRDGVSEGQYQTVLDEEVPKIRKAVAGMYTNRPPRLALIVSVKRHHTRFYPTDPGHMHERSKSPKEGTVVDRGVTNVRYWDFFLQAHASLQGTARPARYTVLLDEIFHKDHGSEAANVLEKLTHNMCYLYGRATKAVSICPPAYYADLVCTRARAHQLEFFADDTSVASDEKAKIMRRTVHENLKDTMYYI